MYSLRKVLVDHFKDRCKLVIGRCKGIGAEKLDRPGVGIGLRDLLQVFLDPLHGRHPEGHFLVHCAELASVVGASLGDLQERPGRPVGISVYGSCKMHDKVSSSYSSVTKSSRGMRLKCHAFGLDRSEG